MNDTAGTMTNFRLPGNGASMFMVWCPPGTFMMGSPETELGHYINEVLHEESVANGFWIGKYPVTQKQYHVLREKHRFYYAGGINSPADSVSHGQALEYCRILTEKLQASISPEWEFTLPSSVQWEYACRAGCESALYHGKEITRKYGRCENIREIAWCYSRDKVDSPQPVGRKRPNTWGICDMLGNVYEWCIDKYVHTSSSPRPREMGGFVVRGGSFSSYPKACRSACIIGQYSLEPPGPSLNVNTGFRVILQRKILKRDIIC